MNASDLRTNDNWHSTKDAAKHSSMGIMVIFLLGIGNFAAQKAVFASNHAILAQLPQFFTRNSGRNVLALEFVILLVALALVSHKIMAGLWAYAIYSALNFLTAWLVLSRRI